MLFTIHFITVNGSFKELLKLKNENASALTHLLRTVIHSPFARKIWDKGVGGISHPPPQELKWNKNSDSKRRIYFEWPNTDAQTDGTNELDH